MRKTFNIRIRRLPAAILLTLAASAAGVSAQAAVTSLNQSWSFYRDDAKAAASIEQVPAAGWRQVDLPHTARIEDRVPTHAWHGTAYYKKSFDAKLAPGERAIVRFEAAMNVADVWFNGKHLGTHLGGYLPFSYDITDLLKAGGGNELSVRVNNEDNAVTGPKPAKDLDYIQYAGLYRGVSLIVKPAVHVSDETLSTTAAGGGVFVTYPQADKASATVRANVEVCNSAADSRAVELRQQLLKRESGVAEAVEQLQLAAGECRQVSQDLKLAKPDLWSPKAPNLYQLRTTVSSNGQQDRVDTRIGIRRIVMENNKLLINGEPLTLRGVNRHQEYPYIGYATSDQANYRDALLIKQAGFDYVRLSHYPQSPAFMAAADELGLMVVPGIPGWQYFNPDPAFSRQTLKTCTDMIRRDRNHASVLAWECSLNETQMPDALISALHQEVHKEYPGDQGYSAGWVPQTYDIYLQARQHRLEHKGALPNKPLIVSEYGDWEYYAMNAGFNQGQWSDLKPADRSSRQLLSGGETHLLQQAKNVAEAHDDNFSTGAIADGYWVMFDYGRGYADDLESSGVYTIDRLPKFGAEFFRSQRSAQEKSGKWGGGPMVFIASYWNKDSSPKVRVFSNADEVEFFANGKRIGRVKSAPSKEFPNLQHPPLEFDLGRFEPGTLKAVAYIGGKPVAHHFVTTPAEAAKLQVSVDDLGVTPVTDDLVFIRARLMDAKGTVVPDSGRKVKFAAGAGYEIVGPQEVETEAGIASVLVRVKGDKGGKGGKGGKGAISAEAGALRGKL